MKHAPELLDDIWHQRRSAILKYYKPKLRIWINEFDLITLVKETYLIPRDTDLHKVFTGSKSFVLFGEEGFVAPDIQEGNPVVEIIKPDDPLA